MFNEEYLGILGIPLNFGNNCCTNLCNTYYWISWNWILSELQTRLGRKRHLVAWACLCTCLDLFRCALIAHMTIWPLFVLLQNAWQAWNFICERLNIFPLKIFVANLIFFRFHSPEFLFKKFPFQLRTHLSLKRYVLLI